MVPVLGLLFSWTGVFVVLLSIVHVIICIFLLAVVLLQRGRTGDLASAFGGPQTSSYAALSTDDLLTRMTKVGAATFMVTSLLLAMLAVRSRESVVDEEIGEEIEALADDATAPATSAPEPTAVEPEIVPPAETVPADGATPTPADGATLPADGATAPAETPSDAVPGDATAPEGATSP